MLRTDRRIILNWWNLSALNLDLYFAEKYWALAEVDRVDYNCRSMATSRLGLFINLWKSTKSFPIMIRAQEQNTNCAQLWKSLKFKGLWVGICTAFTSCKEAEHSARAELVWINPVMFGDTSLFVSVSFYTGRDYYWLGSPTSWSSRVIWCWFFFEPVQPRRSQGERGEGGRRSTRRW